MKCDSRLYERELREIYLKPFKIAIKEGNSKAIKWNLFQLFL